MTADDVAKGMLSRIAELNRLLESLDEAGRERATLWKVERAILQTWADRIMQANEKPIGNGLVMRVDVRKGRTGRSDG